MIASKARSGKMHFGLRKTIIKATIPKRKRILRRKVCPMIGCFSEPKIIHNHLVYVHKLSRGSNEYKDALRMARPVLGDEPEASETFGTFDSDNASSSSDEMNEWKGSEDSETELTESDSNEDFRCNNDGEIDLNLGESENAEEHFCFTSEENEDMASSKNEFTNFVFSEFSDWMESVDGGEKKSEGLTQNISQVRTILIHIDPEHQSVESLLSRENVRNKWLTPFKKELLPGTKRPRRPGTIRSYCNSLRLFIDFLISSKIMKNNPIEDLRAMQTQSKAWAKSLNKQSRTREFEKIYDDFENITNPVEIKNFLESSFAIDAIKLLDEFSCATTTRCPKQNEYCDVRDFLFWHLSLDNGSRPGPLCDITLGQFFNAKKKSVSDTQGNKSIVRVIRILVHKTCASHGAAELVFNQNLYHWFEVFVKNMRGRYFSLPKGDEDYLFVTHEGRAMASKQISGRLTALWKKGFGKDAVCNLDFQSFQLITQTVLNLSQF